MPLTIRTTAIAFVLGLLASSAVLPRSDGGSSAAPGASKLSRLQGKASLGRNRGVVGATVLVRPQDEGSRLFVTASDSRGGFRIDDLPDGDYRVEVRREGLAPVVKEDVGLRFPFRAVIELTMQPAGSDAGTGEGPDPVDPDAPERSITVRGRIVERGGAPMSEVVLRFVRANGEVDPRTVRSDAEGRFRLADLPAGRWRLQARVVGYLSIWTDLSFAGDTDLTVSMVPQPAGYDPSPLELMPPEQPIPPKGSSLDPNPSS